MFEFKLPDPGEGLLEAEIVSWKVAVGDQVAVNDILLEIETAKSLVELPSPAAGTVIALLVTEGTTVDVGTPIVRIGDPAELPDAGRPFETRPAADLRDRGDGTAERDRGVGTGERDRGENSAAGSVPVAEVARSASLEAPEAVAGELQDSNGDPVEPETPRASLVGYGAKPGSITRRPRKRGAVAAVPQTEQVQEVYDLSQPVSRRIDEVTPLHRVDADPSGDVLPAPGEPTGGGDLPQPPLAKPPVRRVARDLGIDLGTITGTGPGGIITHADVLAAAGAKGLTDAPGTSQRVPLRGVRREMFKTMTASLNVPQATAWVEVDVTNTMALVETLRQRREFDGLRISPLLVFAKAACLAIARNPEVNSSFDQAAEEIVIHSDVNLGIAAATPRGLVVPNLKKANRLSLAELAKALNHLVTLAKEGKSQPGDFASGTFTITNVGVFGVDAGTPIMNPGEAAILCVGAVTRRPWVVGSGADERIEPRSVCTLALTFDHRLVDGETGSRFLADVATILAEPGLAMLF